MRAVVIPAPTVRTTPDVTAFAIGFLGATCAFGAPVLALWLAHLNGWC
jgi:hypothetical protein